MSTTSEVHTLPITTIQPSFPAVVNEVYSGVVPAEDIWLSCYDHSSSDSTSLHAKVRVILDDEDREKVVLQVREGDVQIAEAERRPFGNIYNVSSPSLRVPTTRILFPVQQYADSERANTYKPHRITAFALASDKSQYATGYLDGAVFLYPIISLTNITSENKYPSSELQSPSRSTYTSRRQILISAASASSGVSPALARAHKSTVTSLRFFPSSRVLLSSGADFTLHIHPADPISASSISSGPDQSSKRITSVRTFTAHTRSVTATAMIGRGREIISASLDGTIRIWDVSTGKEETLIHSASGVGVGIHRLFMDPEFTNADDSIPNGSLYSALSDGSFEVMKLDASQKPRKLVHEFRSDRSPYGTLNAITVSQPTDTISEKFIAVGSAKGVVSIYKASSRAACIHFRRSNATIEDLVFVTLPSETPSRLGLVVATADGLPWIAALDELSSPSQAEGADLATPRVSVYAELAGGDVDAVRALAAHTSSSSEVEVWTASDDGIVRRYLL